VAVPLVCGDGRYMTQALCKCNRQFGISMKIFWCGGLRQISRLLPGGAAINARMHARPRFGALHRRPRGLIRLVKPHDTGRILAMSSSLKIDRDVFALLDSLGIKHATREHEAVFTVAESVSLRDEIPGGHTKNLFIKDKKSRYFLLTVEENATVDLKTVHTLIGASGRVSFGNADKLLEYLGVLPGSVTAFGAINDTENQVTFILDSDLMAHDIINCHPLRNSATTSIARDDLLRFMEATGHEAIVLKVTQ
jgi:Ala-tRNA(Pro) deacylase